MLCNSFFRSLVRRLYDDYKNKTVTTDLSSKDYDAKLFAPSTGYHGLPLFINTTTVND